MLIQAITSQKYNTNLQTTKQNTNFKGQLGNKVIQNIEKNGAKNIDEVLNILGITGVSAAVVANLKDFVGSVSEKFDSHKNELQESEQAVANILKGFEDKEKELNERENALINTESLLKEAEIEKIKSEMGVVYGGSEKINGYSDYTEQLLMITQLLNQNTEGDIEGHYPDVLIKAVQNKDGVISKEMMTYLENILKLTKGKNNWQPTVQYAIHIVKDKNGNLDQEKAAYLIARSSLKGHGVIEGFLRTYQKFVDNYDGPNLYTQNDYVSEIVNKVMCYGGYFMPHMSYNAKEQAPHTLKVAKDLFNIILAVGANRNRDYIESVTKSIEEIDESLKEIKEKEEEKERINSYINSQESFPSGEKQREIVKMILEENGKYKIDDLDIDTIIRLMQNDNGEISKEMFNFCKKICELEKKINERNHFFLAEYIAYSKNENGDLSKEKSEEILQQISPARGSVEYEELFRKIIKPKKEEDSLPEEKFHYVLDTLASDCSWPYPNDLYTLSSFNFDEFSRPAIKSAINKLLAVDLWLNRDSFSTRYDALVELRNKLEKALGDK